ncbi:hypothetical protein [Sulfuriflexus mobilis]|uniref:hypothetical protein n=1 Tax=Sulfuriflexus mobilis TaxID=1811807 RepID=UPI000F82F281|nr:hypothetical protein [Sulfuriflexus mobilis]
MNAQTLPGAEKIKILLTAYQKHATELLAIEEAQQKLTTLLLAILGAGGSFLAGMGEPLSCGPKQGVTIIVVAITIIGLIYTVVRSRARATTRALLVRCEEALGFYQPEAFIPNDTLYGETLKKFPSLGGWLSWNYALVPVTGLGFLVVLWTL